MTAVRGVSNNILLTGSTGQVGARLLQTLRPLGTVVAPRRDVLDMADAASIRAAVRDARPRWIVNAAAYTAVDTAEREAARAFAINDAAMRVLGEEARECGAVVLHFSTDYVFDGSKSGAYLESDPTAPLSVYGASKLAGERSLAATGAAHVILRTSWVYDSTGSNFLLTILRLAGEKDCLRVVADQHGAPTWSADLAALAACVIGHCERAADGGDLAAAVAPFNGIYHAGCGGATTWHGFAQEAIRLRAAMEPACKLAQIDAITTAEYPTAARRPLNSRLDTGRLARVFDCALPPWQESLRKVMAEL